MFTDTLNADTSSRRQNKHGQAFGTSFGWARADGLKAKSEAHKALSILHERDNVPDTMVMDGSNEQTLGSFQQKCGKIDIHIHEIELCSQWANAVEGQVRELK